MQNFAKKTKIPKFGTKNALFGKFWTGFCKRYCHVGNQRPWFCLTAKFREIRKIPKFGPKNVLSIFGPEFQKNYCHILNQHPQIFLIEKFCKKIKNA